MRSKINCIIYKLLQLLLTWKLLGCHKDIKSTKEQILHITIKFWWSTFHWVFLKRPFDLLGLLLEESLLCVASSCYDKKISRVIELKKDSNLLFDGFLHRVLHFISSTWCNASKAEKKIWKYARKKDAE